MYQTRLQTRGTRAGRLARVARSSVETEPPPEAAPPSDRARSAPRLITADDVKRELYRLFGTAGVEGELVVSFYGGDDDAGAIATFDELMCSLEMHAGGVPGGGLPDARVDAPDADMIERTLRVLGRRDLQRALLDDILTTFGKRLIDPLTDLLDTGPDGAIMDRLQTVRARVLEDVRALGVTHETKKILLGDLEKLLRDEYLKLLADEEEKVQRPRVRALAQDILRMIADVFYAALSRWPTHAGAIAQAARRRVDEQVTLRELPVLIRRQVVDAIEEFLWVETSNDIEGALRSMFASQRGILAAPPTLEREAYREFAEGCWRLITSQT